MNEQTEKGQWVLVKYVDFPKPSPAELKELRCHWVDALVWFFVRAGQWRRGKVYAITKSGEVKIAVRRDGAWVHGCTIRFEYIPRVLRLRSENS